MIKRKPLHKQGLNEAAKAVQVAFDVGPNVLDMIRRVALENRRSASDQIRTLLDLPVVSKPQRPRLTVLLSQEDYQTLSERYGLPADARLAIKAKVTEELVNFAHQGEKGKKIKSFSEREKS